MFLALTSCSGAPKKSNKLQKWTEDQKRKFYTDSFAFSDREFPDRRDSIVNFQVFMDQYYPNLKAKNKYDPLIYALEERYIDTTKVESSTHWFRLTIMPAFRRPFCITLTKDNDRRYLVTKVTNGFGGYYTGTLAAEIKFQLQDTVYDNIFRRLQDIAFWKLPLVDSTCGPGFDGDWWTFELIENGKYNLIHRGIPQNCSDSPPRQIEELGLKVIALSKLDKLLKVFDD